MAGTIALSCNQCGGGLEVPDDSRFLTCGFCGARLAVKHEGNAFFTEVLERVAAAQAGVEELRVQRELDLVDADWEKNKPHWNPERNRSGKATGTVCVVAAIALFLGFLAAYSSGSAELAASLLMLVLMLGIAGAVILAVTPAREQKWREAEAAHQAKRAPLLQRLAEIHGEQHRLESPP